jgi:hypothetical protein
MLGPVIFVGQRGHNWNTNCPRRDAASQIREQERRMNKIRAFL